MTTTTNYEKHKSQNPAQRFLIGRFYSTFLALAKQVKPETILDAGCGEGFTLVKLKRNGIGKVLSGVDFLQDAITLGKRMYPGLKLTKGDIYKLPYKDKSFDLVICTEVLEHLEFPEKAIKEVMRVSKKYVLFSVPNEPIFQLSNFLRGRHFKTFGNHPEHINHWSGSAFEKLLRKNKIRIAVRKQPFPWTLILGRVA